MVELINGELPTRDEIVVILNIRVSDIWAEQ